MSGTDWIWPLGFALSCNLSSIYASNNKIPSNIRQTRMTLPIMNFLLNFDNDFCVVILDGDHGEAVRESGVESRLHSGGINGGRRFRPWPPVFVLPTIKSQGKEGPVRADLGLKFPLRVLDPS